MNIPASAMGRSDAPWLAQDVRCPKCHGKGGHTIIYHLDTGEEITPEQYAALSPEERADYDTDHEECQLCFGSGVVDARYVDTRGAWAV